MSYPIFVDYDIDSFNDKTKFGYICNRQKIEEKEKSYYNILYNYEQDFTKQFSLKINNAKIFSGLQNNDKYISFKIISNEKLKTIIKNINNNILEFIRKKYPNHNISENPNNYSNLKLNINKYANISIKKTKKMGSGYLNLTNNDSSKTYKDISEVFPYLCRKNKLFNENSEIYYECNCIITIGFNLVESNNEICYYGLFFKCKDIEIKYNKSKGVSEIDKNVVIVDNLKNLNREKLKIEI
jgi:hypothetical protein